MVIFVSPSSEPKIVMKQLYWKKQRVNPLYSEKYGSVWKELKKVDPPKEQLVHLFGSLEKEKSKKVEVCD